MNTIKTPANYRPLKPITVGEIPQVYLDSLTYAEQILELIKYIRENVYPTLTNIINTTNENIDIMNDTLEGFKTTIDNMELQVNDFLNKIQTEWDTFQKSIDEILSNYENQYTEFENNITKEFNTFTENITIQTKLATSTAESAMFALNNAGSTSYSTTLIDGVIKSLYNDITPHTTGNINLWNFASSGSSSVLLGISSGDISNNKYGFNIVPNSEDIYPLFTIEKTTDTNWTIYVNNYNYNNTTKKLELSNTTLLGSYINYQLQLDDSITFHQNQWSIIESDYPYYINIGRLKIYCRNNSKTVLSTYTNYIDLSYFNYENWESMDWNNRQFPIYITYNTQYNSFQKENKYLTKFYDLREWYKLTSQFKQVIETGSVDITANFDAQFAQLQGQISTVSNNLNTLQSNVNTDISNLTTAVSTLETSNTTQQTSINNLETSNTTNTTDITNIKNDLKQIDNTLYYLDLTFNYEDFLIKQGVVNYLGFRPQEQLTFYTAQKTISPLSIGGKGLNQFSLLNAIIVYNNGMYNFQPNKPIIGNSDFNTDTTDLLLDLHSMIESNYSGQITFFLNSLYIHDSSFKPTMEPIQVRLYLVRNTQMLKEYTINYEHLD